MLSGFECLVNTFIIHLSVSRVIQPLPWWLLKRVRHYDLPAALSSQ